MNDEQKEFFRSIEIAEDEIQYCYFSIDDKPFTLLKDENGNMLKTGEQVYNEDYLSQTSLDSIKQNKINELSNTCNETITNGFYSDADGTNKLYDFELENQVNLSTYKNNILLSRLSGTPIETISYYAKGETCHDYTADQFLKLVNDGEVFKATNIVRYKDGLKPMVLACDNVDSVNAINWDTSVSV